VACFDVDGFFAASTFTNAIAPASSTITIASGDASKNALTSLSQSSAAMGNRAVTPPRFRLPRYSLFCRVR
jgi:hypothetical protein